MQTLNLIIPMAGTGKRFLDKNYKTYKTLFLSFTHKQSYILLLNIISK